MPHPTFKLPYTPESYLDAEATAPEARHEYLAGDVYAMGGASAAHNIIAGNLFAALHRHLAGTPCRVFMADMKVRLQIYQEDYFYYPDVMVACKPQDNARYYRTQPVFLAEVLSESTQRIDQREKRLAYQHIDSLEEYLILAQDRPEAVLYRKALQWHAVTWDTTVPLASLGLALPLAQLYLGVELP